jgi:hypothetical protein
MTNSPFRLRSSSILFATTAVGLVAIVACTPQGDKPSDTAQPIQACASPAPFPSGFDYPQPSPTIAKWVADRDEKAARRHGWNLWAGLNVKNGDTPVWRSWCTSTQAFATGSPSPSPSASEVAVAAPTPARATPMRQVKINHGSEPINFAISPTYALPQPVVDRYKNSGCISNGSLIDGPNYENNGDIMIAGVVYSQDAYNWIRNNGLYQASTLQGLRPSPTPPSTKQMPAMPPGSIVLKPMMWPVKKGGFTALPIWDPPQTDDDAYAGYEIQAKWPRAVAVTTTPTAQVVPASVTFLHGITMNNAPLGPNTYQKPMVVGTDRFYRFQPDVAKMATCDKAILDASAWWAYNRMFEQGDELIVVAMHIITKEQPAWTFQSVWWHDKPNEGPYAADRPDIPPSKAPGPWRNYLLTNTYGWPEVKGGKQWPVAFNPYIELAADHPIRTNCMNCHHRAAWPGNQNDYLAPGGPGALDMFAYDNNPIFYGLIGVDSMWAISDRAVGSPTPSPSPSASGVGTAK